MRGARASRAERRCVRAENGAECAQNRRMIGKKSPVKKILDFLTESTLADWIPIGIARIGSTGDSGHAALGVPFAESAEGQNQRRAQSSVDAAGSMMRRTRVAIPR